MRKLYLRRLFILALQKGYFKKKYIKFIRILYNDDVKVVLLNQFSHKRLAVLFYYLPTKEYIYKRYFANVVRDRHIFILAVITETAKKIATDDKFRQSCIQKQRDYSKRTD